MSQANTKILQGSGIRISHAGRRVETDDTDKIPAIFTISFFISSWTPFYLIKYRL